MGEAPRGPNPHGGWGALGTHSAPARPSPGPGAGVGSGQGLALHLGTARLAAIPSPVRWAEPPCLRQGGHGLQHRTSPETGPWLSICQGLLLEGDRHTDRGKQVRAWEEQRPRVFCSPLPPLPAAGKWQPGPEARDPDSPLLVSGRKLRRSSRHLAARTLGPCL